jgi:NADPH:quinone reductase-like Zn-dependent oxidoreductase
VLPLYAGAWRERLVVPADGLFPLPAGGSIEQYSMLGSNPPTAGLLLSECAALQPGDWVVQNAANSGVGRSLIALAKRRGLKTINLARDDSTFAELTAAGADVVHVDDADAAADVRALIGDARVALAVEAVGGPGVSRLLDLLSDGGSLVSYSWARDEPMWVDTATLVGKHITVRGFFVGEYDYRDKVLPVIREAAPLVADGSLVVPVAAEYPLTQIQDAVQHLLRGGKILLKVA